MISLKIDHNALAEKVSNDVGKKVSAHYIKCIMSPSSKKASEKIKQSIIKNIIYHMDDNFCSVTETQKVLNKIPID